MSKSSPAAAGSSGLLTLHPWPSTSTEKPRGGSSSASARARPCIYLSAEFMKARKIQTGSPVVIATPNAEALDPQSPDWCLGAAWPSFSLLGNGAWPWPLRKPSGIRILTRFFLLGSTAVSLHPDLALRSKALSSVGGQVKMRGAPGARANSLPAATSIKLRTASNDMHEKLDSESRKLLAIVARERMGETCWL